MRRMITTTAGLALILACTGCVAVAGNRVTACRWSRHPVVVNGELCIVDVQTGEVMKMPPGAVERAGPFHPVGRDDGDD